MDPTDNTSKILEKISLKDKRVKLFSNKGKSWTNKVFKFFNKAFNK